MSLAKLLSPRPCELGKIKIGGLGEERPSQSGGTYRLPVKYDHFIITTLYRENDGKLREDETLMRSLVEHADKDGKLRTLPISLLSNEIEEVLQASYLWYDGKKLAAKSDGETLTKYADLKSGKWLPLPETVAWKSEWADLRDGKGNPRFKLHCTMNVVIASREARWGGFYKFRTTSRITADQLYGSLVQLRQLTGGILRGLPLRLVVRPLQVSPNGKPTTVYVVHVELSGSDVTAIQRQALEIAQHEVANAKMLAAAQAEYRQLLRAPDEFIDDEEEAEVAQEFASHQQPGILPPPPANQPETFPLDTDTEGDDSADPMPASAPTASPTSMNASAISNAPSAANSTQVAPAESTSPNNDPQPLPAPSAERRTSPPKPVWESLIPLMHELGVNWAQIRGRHEGKGAEIANAAKLPQMTPNMAIKDLEAGELSRLHAELVARVREKQQRATQRAANAERKKAGVTS